VLKENVPKEDAGNITKDIRDLGGKITLEKCTYYIHNQNA